MKKYCFSIATETNWDYQNKWHSFFLATSAFQIKTKTNIFNQEFNKTSINGLFPNVNQINYDGCYKRCVKCSWAEHLARKRALTNIECARNERFWTKLIPLMILNHPFEFYSHLWNGLHKHEHTRTHPKNCVICHKTCMEFLHIVEWHFFHPLFRFLSFQYI